jgi:hypothetical protein
LTQTPMFNPKSYFCLAVLQNSGSFTGQKKRGIVG